jgi:hypothetical protein
VEGDRGWGVEPKIIFLSKLISVPCTADCIDVNQMKMLTSQWMSTSNPRHAIKKIVKYFELFWLRLVSKFEKVPIRGNFKKRRILCLFHNS